MTACDCWCACPHRMPAGRGWAGRCDECAADRHTEAVQHIITLRHLPWEAGGEVAVTCRCGWHTLRSEVWAGKAIARHRAQHPPAEAVVMPNAWA